MLHGRLSLRNEIFLDPILREDTPLGQEDTPLTGEDTPQMFAEKRRAKYTRCFRGIDRLNFGRGLTNKKYAHTHTDAKA